MLRKFRIKINEKEYMVEMEEFGAPAVAAAPVQAAPVAVPKPLQLQRQHPRRLSEVEKATRSRRLCPGKILDIKVNVGDVVTENQVLAVLEAMKLENEIVAPRAGTITAVIATKGSPIDVGQTIVIIQ